MGGHESVERGKAVCECNELGVVEVKVTQTMNRHNPLKV